MTTETFNSISMEVLSVNINALLNYKKTGYKQTKAIIDNLKQADLTPSQILEIEPGPWMHFIEKIQPTDDDEKEIKEGIRELMQELNQRFKKYKDGSLSFMKKTSKDKAEAIENKNTEDKENARIEANMGKPTTTEEPEKTKGEQEGNKDQPEPLSETVRDFTVKNLAQGLLVDFKDKPQAKKEAQSLAKEKAAKIENIIREDSHNDSEAYRMEARNVSNFLMTKNNESLREGLLQGEINCEEFVHNKEEFLHDHAKSVIKENEERHYQDVNADFDRHMVPISQLYKCENCGSRRISKTEKQINAANKESTSVLFCADCEAVILK